MVRYRNRGNVLIRLWDAEQPRFAEKSKDSKGIPVGRCQPDGHGSPFRRPTGARARPSLESESVHSVSFIDDVPWRTALMAVGLQSSRRTGSHSPSRRSEAEPVSRRDRHKALVFKGVFSADSHRFATYGRDRTVRLWHFPGGECKVLRGRTDDVLAAGFHADGTRLATAAVTARSGSGSCRREDVARLSGRTGHHIARVRSNGQRARIRIRNATIRLSVVRSRSEPSKMKG